MCYNKKQGSGIMDTYQVGDIIEAEVTGITNYGIFVSAENGYNGLIHISEVSSYYVKSLEDYVSVGEHILCEILEVFPDVYQLKLSIKNINYKLVPRFGNLQDTPDGFKNLQMNLPIWIREKLKELD